MVVLSLHFGFRARDESLKLRWGDVEPEQQNDGRTMHEDPTWSGERTPKSISTKDLCHQYSEMSCQLLQKIPQSSPVEMNAPESPFYLAVRHNRRSNEEVWYMKAPLGKKNGMAKFLSTAAKNAGRHREGEKVTNHSVKKTCISRLPDADVPENFVAQLSGHKSTESLQSYKSASAKHQEEEVLDPQQS